MCNKNTICIIYIYVPRETMGFADLCERLPYGIQDVLIIW